MNKNDDLQFTPMMRGKIQYTNDEFKETNIKNHGVKKGTVKWYHKKIIIALVIGGSHLALTAGAIHAFDLMNGAPKETTITIGEDRLKGYDDKEIIVDGNKYSVVSEESKKDDISVREIPTPNDRTTVDYLVKSGDTLDGIIYKYTDSANEKDYYKNYVKYYNNIGDGDVIQMGQVITLVGVPMMYADDLNTGYNESYNKSDEISFQLNGAVQELLDEVGRDYPKGSLVDTIVKELEVYNGTTNSKTRSYLAKTMLFQIENVKEYGNSDTMDNALTNGKSR